VVANEKDIFVPLIEPQVIGAARHAVGCLRLFREPAIKAGME
jgi:hypothetical protein